MAAGDGGSKLQLRAGVGDGWNPRPARRAFSATHICSAGVQRFAVPLRREEVAAVGALE